MSHQNITEKTAKIVFASNVPTDMAEDRIREFFGKVGPVVSFRVICDKDKDTGKSRAYAICEYKDPETALNAVKIFKTTEIAGRYMKVNHALVESTKLEMISVMQRTQVTESSTEKTPETISKAVASLPPEQMFELLKQMKQCVQNNAGEAKNMLLQNPQLAYALLQALVVMRVVDPLVAVTALNNATSTNTTSSTINNDSTLSASSMINRISSSAVSNTKPATQSSVIPSTSAKPIQPVPPPAPSIPHTVVPPAPVVHDIDLRVKPAAPTQVRAESEKAKQTTESYKRDPRLQLQSRLATTATPAEVFPHTVLSASRATSNTSATAGKPVAAPLTAESEKAALIMQVLRLTDAQIATLPAEQRQSILLLKEQIAKSTKR